MYTEPMSKPILPIRVTTLDEKTAEVRAVFDTGSFYTIIREDKVPKGASVLRRSTVKELRAASKGSRVTAVAEVFLVLTIGEKMVEDAALISPDLAQEMLVGAGTMQKWDISIMTTNGKTEVVVARDMRDPDITEVD